MNQTHEFERYLLGDLSAAERDDLETRLLADGDLAEALAIAEDELLDAYVAGELTDAQRRAFENHRLETPQQRQRLAFAHALRRVARDETDAGRQPGRILDGRSRFQRWASPLLAAAAALLLVVGGVLWQGNRELGERLAGLEKERTELLALQQSLEAERSATGAEQAAARQQLEAELEDAHQRLEELSSELQVAKGRRTQRPPKRAAFVLAAALRSTTGPRDLALPGDTEIVDLTLEIGSQESYLAFTALLYGPEGRERWSRADLAGEAGTGGTAVRLAVPAGSFGSGLHEILLYGRPADGAGGEPELLGSFEFSVARP